ncbi:Uncharacterized protein PKNOH_S120141700 [Plasmodium knowlesi]|uniref:Uncharacterized protein n=1 Tax=Plasmodium knowlesi TaxID=5850 RepID=A0A1Y3DJQ6_PLAKN|nr:Uncharacterized protein PKNOH_S120141700 [Plasmodium knowlesi]
MQTKRRKGGAKDRAISHGSVLKKNAVATMKQSRTNVRHIDKLKILKEINNEGRKNILMEDIEKVKEIASFLKKTSDKNSLKEKKNNEDRSRSTVLKHNEPNINRTLTEKEKKEHSHGRGPTKEDTHPRGRTSNKQVTHNRSRRTNERKTLSTGDLVLQDDMREEESLSTLLQGLSKKRGGSSEEGASNAEGANSVEEVSSAEEVSNNENRHASRGSTRRRRGAPSSRGRNNKSHSLDKMGEVQKGVKSDNSAKGAKIGKSEKNVRKEEKVKKGNMTHVKEHHGNRKSKNKKDHIVIDDNNIYIVIDDLNEQLNDKNAIINKLNITNDTYNFLMNKKKEMRGGKRTNAHYSFMGDSHPVRDQGVKVDSLEGIDIDADEEDAFYGEGDDEEEEILDDDNYESYNDENSDDEEDEEEEEEQDDDDDGDEYDFDNKSVSIRGIGEDSTNDELEDLEFSEIYESHKTKTGYLHTFEGAMPEGEQARASCPVEISKKEKKRDQVEGGNRKEQIGNKTKRTNLMKDESLDKGGKKDEANLTELRGIKPLSPENAEGDVHLVKKGNVKMNDQGVRKSKEEANPNSVGGKRRNRSTMELKDVRPQWEEAQKKKSGDAVKGGKENKLDQGEEQWNEESVIPIIPLVPVLPVEAAGLEKLLNMQEIYNIEELEEESELEQEEQGAEKRKRRKKMDHRGKREKIKMNSQKGRRNHKSDELDRLYKQINKKDTNIDGKVDRNVEDEMIEEEEEDTKDGDSNEEDEFNSSHYSKIEKLLSISKDISKYNMTIDITDEEQEEKLSNVSYTFKGRGENLDKEDKNRSKEKVVLLPLQMECLQGSSIDKGEIKKTKLKNIKRRGNTENRKEEKKAKMKRKYSKEGMDGNLKRVQEGSYKNADQKELTERKEGDKLSGAYHPGGELSKGMDTLKSKRKNAQEGKEENVNKRLKKDECVGGVNSTVKEKTPPVVPILEESPVVEESVSESASTSEQKDANEESLIVAEKGGNKEEQEENPQAGEVQSDQIEDINKEVSEEPFTDMVAEDAEVNVVLKELIEEGTAAREEEAVRVEEIRGEEEVSIEIDEKGESLAKEDKEDDQIGDKEQDAEEVVVELKEIEAPEEVKEEGEDKVDKVDQMDEVDKVDQVDQVDQGKGAHGGVIEENHVSVPTQSKSLAQGKKNKGTQKIKRKKKKIFIPEFENDMLLKLEKKVTGKLSRSEEVKEKVTEEVNERKEEKEEEKEKEVEEVKEEVNEEVDEKVDVVDEKVDVVDEEVTEEVNERKEEIKEEKEEVNEDVNVVAEDVTEEVVEVKEEVKEEVTEGVKDDVMHDVKEDVKEEVKAAVEEDEKEGEDKKVLEVVNEEVNDEVNEKVVEEVNEEVFEEVNEEVVEEVNEKVVEEVNEEVVEEVNEEVFEEVNEKVVEEVNEEVVEEVNEVVEEVNEKVNEEVNEEVVEEVNEKVNEEVNEEVVEEVNEKVVEEVNEKVNEEVNEEVVEEMNEEDVPAIEGVCNNEESGPQEKEDMSELRRSANEILVEDRSEEYQVPDHGSNDNESTNSDFTDLNVSSRKVSCENEQGCQLDKESSLKTLEELRTKQRLEMETEECDESFYIQVENGA